MIAAMRGKLVRIQTLFVLLMLLLCQSTLFSQDKAPDTETWYGVLDVKVAKLRMLLSLSKNESGEWSGHLESLDQANSKLLIDTLTVTDKALELEVKSVGAKYKGDFSDDHKSIVGTFSQSGAKFDLTFERRDSIPTQNLVEAWQGTLVAGTREFDFQIRIQADDAGQRSGFLDSFNEGALGLQLVFAPPKDDQDLNSFDFDLPISKARYEGTKNESGEKIAGDWIQAKQKYPLEFNKIRVEDVRLPESTRPQTPKPPFNYNARELKLELVNNIEIAGTLTWPSQGKGPFSVVVLVSGSGPQDRDETIFQHKPFAIWADKLTKRGLAVFRYDERGVGESTGTYSTATSEDFAADVNGILDELKKLPEISPNKLCIMGHSEGGLIAPMVAVNRKDVAAIVLLAGPSVPGAQIILNQSRVIAAASGIPTETLDEQEKMLRLLLGMEDKKIDDQKEESMTQSFENFMDKLGDAIQGDTMEAAKKQFEQPWFKFFLKYDPQGPLRKIQTPILAVFGSKDLQVTPALNVTPMREALEASGNKDYAIVELEGLNHLFQRCTTGSPSEYVLIEQTLDEAVLKTVSDWLVERMN